MKSKIINRVRERQGAAQVRAWAYRSRAAAEQLRVDMKAKWAEDAKFFNGGEDWFLPPKRWYQFWR